MMAVNIRIKNIAILNTSSFAVWLAIRYCAWVVPSCDMCDGNRMHDRHTFVLSGIIYPIWIITWDAGFLYEIIISPHLKDLNVEQYYAYHRSSQSINS